MKDMQAHLEEMERYFRKGNIKRCYENFISEIDTKELDTKSKSLYTAIRGLLQEYEASNKEDISEYLKRCSEYVELPQSVLVVRYDLVKDAALSLKNDTNKDLSIILDNVYMNVLEGFNRKEERKNYCLDEFCKWAQESLERPSIIDTSYSLIKRRIDVIRLRDRAYTSTENSEWLKAIYIELDRKGMKFRIFTRIRMFIPIYSQ